MYWNRSLVGDARTHVSATSRRTCWNRFGARLGVSLVGDARAHDYATVWRKSHGTLQNHYILGKQSEYAHDLQ